MFLLPHHIPSLLEASTVLRDVLRPRVKRPVRRGVGEVEEERPLGIRGEVLADEARRHKGAQCFVRLVSERGEKLVTRYPRNTVIIEPVPLRIGKIIETVVTP